MTFDLSGVMWAEATRDREAEVASEQLIRGKIAAASYWPFLAAATSDADFGHRHALIEDNLAAVIPAQVREAVLVSIFEDWKLLNEAKVAAKQEALQHAASRQVMEDSVAPGLQLVHGSQQYYHAGLGRWVAAGSKYPNSESSFTLPTEIHEGSEDAQDGYRDARFHDSRGFDLRDHPTDWLGESEDYRHGYGLAHEHMAREESQHTSKLAYIDPSDAQRYSTYPDMNPAVDNGPLQGPDGFVTGGEGEDRSGVGYARQLTPGQWVVTPGTEWPVKPNAADPTQVPRTAANWLEHHVTDRFKPDFPSHDINETAYNQGRQHGMEDRGAGAEHSVGARMRDAGEPSYSERKYYQQGYDQQYHNNGMFDPSLASHRQAGEGIVPTPGPNPNYFSQGSEGIGGPPTFPDNPSGEIEPKTDNRIDDIYGTVPPQQSGGSAEGYVDGGGYSNQVANSTARRHPFAPEASASGWFYRNPKLEGGGDWKSHEEMQRHLSSGKAQQDADGSIHLMSPDTAGVVRTYAPLTKSVNAAAGAHKPRIVADGSGGYRANCTICHWHGDSHSEKSAATAEYRTHTKSPKTAAQGEWTYGEDGKLTPPADFDAEAWDRGVKQMADAEKRIRNNNRAGPGYSRDQDGRTQPHHAATDGRIVGRCDHCSHPVRYHTNENGVDELRHLHSNSNTCSDGKKATSSIQRQAAFYDPADPTLIVLATGVPTQGQTTPAPESSTGTDQNVPVPDPAQQQQQQATARRLQASHVDDYLTWARSNGHNPDDLKSLLHYERQPGIGRSTTNRIADEYHVEGPEWRELARQSSLSTQADGSSRMRPTWDNPTGAGDDFTANTWENGIKQRPLQSREDRGTNSPTSQTDPVPTVSSSDASPRDNDLDEDRTNNQGADSREASLLGMSIEELMGV